MSTMTGHRTPLPALPLPRIVADLIKKLALDRFRGSVQLNFKDGRVIGYHVTHVAHLSTDEIQT